MTERDESEALASAILENAGWIAINSKTMAGRYVVGDLVGGIDPGGTSHIKTVGAIQPGNPLYGADTPDEPHEAAQWLVDRFKAQQAANALHTETVLEPPRIVLDEPEELAEDSGDEAHTQDAPSDPVTADEDCADESPTDESAASGHSILAGGFDETWGPAETEDGGRDNAPEGPIDADFSEPAPELGQELAEEHPEEFGGAGDAGGKFYFSDNLDQMRREVAGVIGIIAEQKSAEVEAAANEQPDEYVTLQGFVTTNLDKFTGMFSLQDEESRAKYRRWVELDSAHKTVILVDRRRRDLTKMILAATREEIEAFDPEAGWP